MNTKTLLLAELKKATKDSPLYRYEFAARVGQAERTVRSDISELRKSGHRICSNSEGKGYWMAKNYKDYQRFRAEYVSRAVRIFETVGAMDGNLLGQIGGLEK